MTPETTPSPSGSALAAPRMSPTERIDTLDVLRGIALLGMFLVHFSNYSSGGGSIGEAYQKFVALFLEERFWAMFGILFGAGFAIQFLRSDARGESFIPKYLRRMLGLAVFGFIAHAVFGFNVLLGYAAWGLPLVLVRRWSTHALLVALVISAVSANVYFLGRAVYGVATRGEEGVRTELKERAATARAFYQANRAEQDAATYSTVFVGRLHHMRFFYAQWFSFLPVNTFTLFLLGVLALRLGLFDRPEEHRRLIVALMAFGVVSWSAILLLMSRPTTDLASPVIRSIAIDMARNGLGILRPMWLTFAYIGTVLLLVAHNRVWLRRLAVFGWTGRMALTNYMIQIAILDLTFANYALGASITPLAGMVAGCALFLVDAVLSRWWLARFRFGPLEWLWRSITYARWQPWRLEAPVTQTPLVATP